MSARSCTGACGRGVTACAIAVFWMLLDLDEIDELDAAAPAVLAQPLQPVQLLRCAITATDATTPLRAQVERHLQAAGIDPTAARSGCSACRASSATASIRSASTSATAGDGALAALLYEVHNTFGERHSYLIPVDRPAGAVVAASCDKGFYVSPFMDMDMRYEFRVAPPDERVSVAIGGGDDAMAR